MFEMSACLFLCSSEGGRITPRRTQGLAIKDEEERFTSETRGASLKFKAQTEANKKLRVGSSDNCSLGQEK